MPFKKGHPKIGGRQAGITKQQTVAEICAKHNFNPTEALIEMAKNSRESAIRFGAAKELQKYVAPALKMVEVSGAIDLGLKNEIDNLKQLTDEELKQIVMAEPEPKKIESE